MPGDLGHPPSALSWAAAQNHPRLNASRYVLFSAFLVSDLDRSFCHPSYMFLERVERVTPIPTRGRRSSTVPTSITDAISTATSSRPPAITSRRSPCGSPSAWRPFRRPATSRSMLPGSQRAEEPGGNGPELPRTRNVGTGRPERTAFRLPVPRATERGRSLVSGGRRAEHSAHPAFRLDSGRSAVRPCP